MSERVGTIRPSQLMYSYGVGSVVDLPNFSVIVGGLDGWDISATGQTQLVEERLLDAVRSRYPQVTELRPAPWMQPQPGNNALADWARVGVLVYIFPRWLRCTGCNSLAPVDENSFFHFKGDVFRPERARFEHSNCLRMRGRTAPKAIPARFVLACQKGHLDEFPWEAFVHRFGTCPKGKPLLTFADVGIGSRSTDAVVVCQTCQEKRYMGEAFGPTAAESMPRCRGRHPHLRRFDQLGCDEQAQAMLLGASNAWFPETLSTLALPVGGGSAVAEVVDQHWAILSGVEALTDLEAAVKFNPSLRAALAKYKLERVWDGILARKNAPLSGGDVDLLTPEWDLFIDPANAPASNDFRVRAEPTSAAYTGNLSRIVLAERLREVVALLGFTRVEGPDSGVVADVQRGQSAPLEAKNQPTWLPASEVRGEGIFLQLNEGSVSAWVAAARQTDRLRGLLGAHENWRRRRGISPPDAGWPGARYVLIHSLSHAIINQVALECGYSAASIRERLYVRQSSDPDEAMAGVLLYTAAPDSEGTLGGLVQLGKTDRFQEILANTLERMRLCSADPFCSGHVPTTAEDVLHNAACHACLFVPETSCERGNRYLDRATLTETMAGLVVPPFFTAV